MAPVSSLASSTDTGSLGVFHLKRLWSATIAQRAGLPVERNGERILDTLLLNVLGLGLHQTFQYLYATAPSFAEFEHWIIATAGNPDKHQVERFNAEISKDVQPNWTRQWLETIDHCEPVLSQSDLACWERNGYVRLKDAISKDACAAAENLIWSYVDADSKNPDSWYSCTHSGIMVELIQHHILDANRRSPRIHKAFAQLWGTTNLCVTADRCGFHPPQHENHPFPGPDLHWDIDFNQPLTFGTQGILYLTDTSPEQGALTLVPGFHHRLSDWLQTLEPDADPQFQDLHALGSVAIGGQAGDMIIWHQALPHGSRPNLGTYPRIVQYINMLPGPHYERQTIAIRFDC